MIYAITFSPFRSQSSTHCDMGDVNDGRTGSVGVSLEPNTLASRGGSRISEKGGLLMNNN